MLSAVRARGPYVDEEKGDHFEQDKMMQEEFLSLKNPPLPFLERNIAFLVPEDCLLYPWKFLT